jgi:hypothetical protein
MYLLWSVKAGGWIANSVTATTTIREDARQFSQAEAMRAATKQYRNGLSEFGLLPVRVEDLAFVTDSFAGAK